MGQSVRYVIHGVHGRVPQNFNWPAIKSNQAVVHITAGEVVPGGTSDGGGPGGLTRQNFMYHIGNANVWISNVSPHFNDHFNGEPGGVEFVLNVDFPSPINVAVTIAVEDRTPLDIQPL
jgi:hypothetical protein